MNHKSKRSNQLIFQFYYNETLYRKKYPNGYVKYFNTDEDEIKYKKTEYVQ